MKHRRDSPYPFRVDLHVHTRRYSPCAEGLDPMALAEEIGRRGLFGVVITEHDHLWSADEIASVNHTRLRGRIFRGAEISSCNGHFIVVGLDNLSGLQAGVSVETIIAVCQAGGAAIIWAHPFLNYGQTVSPRRPDQMPAGLHAVEVASSMTDASTHRQARRMARGHGWTMVGGSDAHTLSQIGTACTGFREAPEDEYHLAAMIRTGQCRAIAGPGTMRGASCS